jgi:lysophospholipase L1-like esterase
VTLHQILVYADSLTWGIIPDTRKRLPFEERWPGVMERCLLERGKRVRTIEDCLNGRRTVFDDPYKPGRNALASIEQAIEAHSPLALVILMLGTNDFQSMHPHTAWHSAQGVAALIDAIRRAPIEPGMPVPKILVVAPPRIENPRGAIAPKFTGADEKSRGLSEALMEVAQTRGCELVDAAKITASSRVDGVHLDADQHQVLGRAVAESVRLLLPDD